MHLHFIDDSGTISPPHKITQQYFVLGGPVIPEEQWHNLETAHSKVCNDFDVRGEIKWRFFGQRHGCEDKGNTLSHLNISERDKLRTALLTALMTNESIKIIAVAIHLPTIYKSSDTKAPEQVHGIAHKSLMDLFQMYLHELSQDTGSMVNGMIISDHRNPIQDMVQRNLHQDILKANNITHLTYPNLIEGLFFCPSHHSIGIQFADLVSGAIFRHYEHQDDKWYNLLHNNFLETEKFADLRGVMKCKKEKDAESVDLSILPNLRRLTQSQRISKYKLE